MSKSISAEKKIIDAARSVFIKKGLSGARMQEIADEAGINKALLHYYFRNKEKLFNTIFEEVFLDLSIDLERLFTSKLSVFDKLKELIDLYSNLLSKNPYLPNFILNEISQNPKRMQNTIENKIIPVVMNFFVELMREINNGKIRAIHPAHLILNLIGMLVLPYAVKPMIEPVFRDKIGIDYNTLLAERKEVIYEFVCNALKIDDHEN
jgi:AcrR family transcriptional regulator